MAKTWWNLAKRIGRGLFDPNIRKRFKESMRTRQPFMGGSEFFPSDDQETEQDEREFRKISGGVGQRDIPSDKQDDILQASYYLYVTNPLARRIINMYVDFTLGDGIKFQAENPKVQSILKDFWNDPVNKLDIKSENKVRELGMYGEQIYPAFVEDNTGHVRLGYIDPLNVADVECDKENCEVLTDVILRQNAQDSEDAKRYRVIQWTNEIEEVQNGQIVKRKVDQGGMLDGKAFLFRINAVTNQRRGLSDLSHLVDWLDGFDFLLFSLMDHADMMKRWVYDVTIKGGTPEQIADFLKTFGIPKPGSVRAHNELIDVQTLSPELKAADYSEAVRLFRQQILGGAGFPEHWFAEGSTTNRATAAEAGLPSIKMLERRQRVVIDMFRTMLQFQIDQVLLKNPTYFSADDRKHLDFTVTVPKISERDAETVASVLTSISNAMVQAVTLGLIQPQTATQLLLLYIRDLGVDTEKEEKAIREQIARMAEEPEKGGPPTEQEIEEAIPDRDYGRQGNPRMREFKDRIADATERSIARKRT